ncbi:hypothetical protein CONLIGDRAFT_695032 [Coniochaeta ligniaria NRRL 30616]|uniref:Knr4/Smi1-like domain-containing protein n=1 Tax=Coniochaeta ligniaria NRRL 30616 TaxID=1408157 RepID=A0A1J7IYL8_9PEZI|nr:hypothetical protein CONLIGDRAFT_695032 [Coniochaeta ligniaria NRRL 30616]
MDDERRASIEAALRRYRETVTQHSVSLLHTLSPRDLLDDDVRDKVIRRTGMDGLGGRPEVNLKGREEYFAAIRTRIAELNVEVAEFPPADLAYLCTLTDGITGPGLPYERVSRQIEFLSPFEEGGFGNSVGVPVRYDEDGDEELSEKYDELTWIWTDWEVAVAFQFGGAPFTGGSLALYCRKDGKEWKWRYGIYDDDWCSDAYDSVEEFLDYYAHFREQTEEEVRKDVNRGGLPR